MAKSAATFVRKELGIWGGTEHSGRGWMDMKIDRPEFTTADELKKLVAAKIREWTEKGIVDRVTTGDFGLRVYFTEECGFGYYRGFRFSENLVNDFGYLGQIFMVMEN